MWFDQISNGHSNNKISPQMATGSSIASFNFIEVATIEQVGKLAGLNQRLLIFSLVYVGEITMVQASQIRNQMQIVGSDGQQLGSVEQVDGSSRIKFAPKGAASGGNHFIPLAWVASVDGQTVKLSQPSHDVQQELERTGAPRRA